MDLPIYELKIQEALDDSAEVSYIALVDAPAIKKDFVVFSQDFVEPTTGEHKDKFLPRCISYVINEGKDNEQAVAICNSIWDQHFADASYNDYPESAKLAAERGIKLNEKVGNKCATQVGKVRAQQIMNGENLSKETIKRTYSYLSRAAAYYNPNDSEACGTISYLLWGGESMLRWCESKMNSQDFAACPIATQDIKVNLKNRGNAISVANYGPANPALPNEQYWIDKGAIFGGTAQDAKTMTCNNCAAFNRSKDVLDCIAQGLGENTAADPWATIEAGNLGYCEIFDFKCASSRTCNAWVAKSQMAADKVSFDYDDTLSTARGKELAKKEIANGATLYIISARQDKQGMLATAKDLGIPESRVYATGSNTAKIEKIKELAINKHYDNNADVISKLDSVGHKFNFMGFAIQSEDKHIISGPLMLADTPIYRNNSKYGEHYVTFSAETIKEIAIKFSKKGYQQNVNLMHDSNMQLDGLVMFESFIVDKERGIAPMAGFEDAKDGSWFGSFYVENDQAWQLIKDGKVKGFSVEGFFDYALPENRQKSYAEQKLSELAQLLKVPI